MSGGVRLEWLEQGLYEALSGVADDVAWAHGSQPRAAGSLLSLRLASGPSGGKRSSRHGGSVKPRATAATITVTGAVEGERYELRLDGFSHRHDVQPGETIGDVRDALLASAVATHADELGPVANGTDGIDVAATAVDALWDVGVSGDLDAAITHDGEVRVGEVTNRATVQINAYSQKQGLADSAHQIMQNALARLRDHDVLQDLCGWGVAVVGRGEAVTLNDIAGAQWESRCVVTLELSLKAVYVETIDPIVLIDIEVEDHAS